MSDQFFDINHEAVQEWIDYRKAKKKPLSDLALKKVRNKLAKHEFDVQQAMVDRAIENDWLGLYEMKSNKHMEKTSSTRHRSIMEDLNDTSWAI